MSKQRRQEGSTDDGLPWGWFAAIFLTVVMWFIFNDQISWVVMWVRYAEAHLMVFDGEGKLMMVEFLGRVRPEDATFMQLIESGAVAGYSLRWFSAAFLIGWFIWLYRKASARAGRMTKKHSMESLAQQEAENYPALLPVLNADMARIPLDDPVNGMRQDARFYCRRHGLVLPRWTRSEDVPADAMVLADGRYLLRERAEKVFAKQLGRRWDGVDRLKAHERSLLAAFIAQVNADATTAQAILNGINLVWTKALKEGKPELLTTPQVDEAISKYIDSPKVVALIRQHYHVRCVLRRLLEEARTNGKLPTPWFRWLKMADRTTWYVMNDLGLDVASVEAAGVHSHYMAEKLAATAIQTPLVVPAVDGTADALNSLEDDENV